MKRIKHGDVVCLTDLKLLEKEFKCPIRTQILRASIIYLGVEINSISEISRFLGKGKGDKLGFNGLRKVINATW